MVLVLVLVSVLVLAFPLLPLLHLLLRQQTWHQPQVCCSRFRGLAASVRFDARESQQLTTKSLWPLLLSLPLLSVRLPLLLLGLSMRGPGLLLGLSGAGAAPAVLLLSLLCLLCLTLKARLLELLLLLLLLLLRLTPFAFCQQALWE